MSFLHVDQRPVRARCEEILARVAAPEAPDRDVRRDVAYAGLLQTLRDARLVPGTTPEGVSRLLLTARDTGRPETWRRSIDRAIPLRGALRRGPALAALAALAGIAVGLVWISPWIPVAVVVILAWIGLRAIRRFLARRAGPVIAVARMEEAARAAELTGEVEAANALYAEARRMIAEDRVPAGVGFRVANVLRTAATSTPFPVDLLRELRQLLLIAPEAELSYRHVRDEIERRLQTRVETLATRIRRALRAGEPTTPLRAELRELARTAPGVTGARAHQAEILRQIALAAMDPDPAAPLDELLDEIEELIARLEAIDGGVSVRDRSPRELGDALDEIVARSMVPGAAERARALQARIEALPIRSSGRRPARRDLHAAIAAIAQPDQIRPQVVALYRQARDDAARGHERRQRELVTAMRLASTWACKHGEAAFLGEIRDDARELFARRSIPAGTGAELAGVLRDCVSAASFPTTLLDDFAALRALAPDLAAPHYWSIVDAAILRVEARIDEIAKTGGAGSRAALREIAAAFEATATLSRDPEIVERARRLAALTSPSP